jgi:hypothetical protein
MTYGEVFEMLWRAEGDPASWRYKRRHTVLGLWHQIKQEGWERHKMCCARPLSSADMREVQERILSRGLVPNFPLVLPDPETGRY